MVNKLRLGKESTIMIAIALIGSLIITILLFKQIELGLSIGLTALVVGFISVILSISSAEKMTALADSQIDEKLAMMAKYLADVKATLKMMKEPYPRGVWTLNEIRMLNSDFNAISELKKYASPKRKRR